MKTIIFICALLQFVLPATSQLNKDYSQTVLNTKPLVSPLTGSLVTHLQFIKRYESKEERKLKKNFPMPVYLTTIDNKVIPCMIQDVGDSSILIVSKSRKANPDLNGTEINYSNIREIKIRRKNGILKGVLLGAIAGALPVAGGIIVGQAQGGGFVTMVTLPAGIITGGIIGTSHKKYHINGNAASFSSFKTNIQ